MLQSQRNDYILKELQLGKPLSVIDLSNKLEVSVDTIRRDLKSLDSQGLLKYVRGGACLPDTMLSFSNFKGREIINSSLKRDAAKKAVKFVKEGDIIALNAGTTNTILAQELVQLNFEFTVVSNNLAALNILMENSSIKYICIGGKIDGTERATYGSQCTDEFGEYIADIAFLSINAVNLNEGFTDFRLNEIPVIKTLSKNSKKVIAVMDSSKMNKLSKKKALSLHDVDILVTDSQFPSMAEYEKNGVIVL